MLTLSHSIDIDAPADRVWAVFTDTGSYPEWNPFMTKVEGDLITGSRLAVTIVPPGGRPNSFRPTVTTVEPERRLRWLGRLLLPGIVDGAHSFELEPLSPGTTRFTQSERFSGLLVPLLRGMLRSAEAGFAEMNTALAARAESRPA
ncbi:MULTISPECIES: SRPBCC domain-containing protein [Pseudonocardia]|uniref:Polyketide cyclase / dehydrase and lipid transport n=2 Tax=Pseudonocardia TaxID=1847 RepID=A0A1Y2N0S6_PSEAH|nr:MULTISPECIES: SRPBCC domain-containing protein [Pseudonocardia]OSY40769.1 Polyketide cyclase / dehydrase and lipid transport [Pseudonocardia autotrophica]TDN71924.1 hypothetical protein C8E95_0959 [Pseudonocardia autotrophica]BBG02611.1 hypothetical protein Pdca_38200 [Pseudonocardia autotrophica]GEC24670.1 hypothetical protein PSA01_16990 [Pseudonocardia saturnea]